MDFNRLYAHRFRNVDQALRSEVWRVIAGYIHQLLGHPDVVLDPAAGRGEFINAIPARERWAIDLADTRTYLDQGVKFVQSDILAADLPPDHFDAVFVSNFLEHLPHPEAVQSLLAKLQSTLKRGGYIAIMGPNFRYCMKDYFDCADHTLILTEESVQEHLYAAGFTVAAAVPKFLPYSFRQRLPVSERLVRWYLRLPWLWTIFGKQFLVLGRKAAVEDKRASN